MQNAEEAGIRQRVHNVRFYQTIVGLYQTNHRAIWAILEEFPCFRSVLADG